MNEFTAQSSTDTEERLRKLWEAGSRDIAISFLRRAITPDMTFAELLSALEFCNAKQELGNIRLVDVMQSTTRNQEQEEDLHRNGKRPPPVTPTRRKRSSSRPIEEMKRFVLEKLLRSSEGINSPTLGQFMKSRGFDTDSAKTYQLLKALSDAGHVVGEGERPKVWKITLAGRQYYQQR